MSGRAAFFYSKVDKLEQATHVLIHGRDGNIEICKLENLTSMIRPLLTVSHMENLNYLKEQDYLVSFFIHVTKFRFLFTDS